MSGPPLAALVALVGFVIGLGLAAAPAIDARPAPVRPPAAAAARSVPFGVGLTVVTAIASGLGDYESIKRIDRITANDADLLQSAELPSGGHSTSRRTIHLADLRAAHWYKTDFAPGSHTIDGATAIGVSAEMIEDLRARARRASAGRRASAT